MIFIQEKMKSFQLSSAIFTNENEFPINAMPLSVWELSFNCSFKFFERIKRSENSLIRLIQSNCFVLYMKVGKKKLKVARGLSMGEQCLISSEIKACDVISSAREISPGYLSANPPL